MSGARSGCCVIIQQSALKATVYLLPLCSTPAKSRGCGRVNHWWNGQVCFLCKKNVFLTRNWRWWLLKPMRRCPMFMVIFTIMHRMALLNWFDVATRKLKSIEHWMRNLSVGAEGKLQERGKNGGSWRWVPGLLIHISSIWHVSSIHLCPLTLLVNRLEPLIYSTFLPRILMCLVWGHSVYYSLKKN